MNSIEFILKKEFGYNDLRVIHRLDKLTSGVCILAKNSLAAAKMHNIFRNQLDLKKEYLALVDGEFPAEEVTCSAAIEGYKPSSESDLKMFASPKESVTVFRRLDFDGKCSLVWCIPQTGRTHQIRIHLDMLGFHIVNDSTYNKLDNVTYMAGLDDSVFEDGVRRLRAKAVSRGNEVGFGKCATSWVDEVSRRHSKAPDCLTCEIGSDFFRENLQLQDRMFMCLHAWKYRVGSLVVEAPMPAWVQNREFLESVFRRREAERRQSIASAG